MLNLSVTNFYEAQQMGRRNKRNLNSSKVISSHKSQLVLLWLHLFSLSSTFLLGFISSCLYVFGLLHTHDVLLFCLYPLFVFVIVIFKRFPLNLASFRLFRKFITTPFVVYTERIFKVGSGFGHSHLDYL